MAEGSIGCIVEATENVSYHIKEKEFEHFYNALNYADRIIAIGEGRSQSALYIGIGQMNEKVGTMIDLDFPGSNIVEAAPVLEKKYDKIALLINSGSGETSFPRIVVKQLHDYIERTRTKQFTINAVVSNVDSSIGKIGEKKYGNVIELRGREIEGLNNSGKAFLKHGIMNDTYELGSLLLFQKTKEAINAKNSYNAVFRNVFRESKTIIKIVEEFINWEYYWDIIDKIEARNRITIGGIGPARNVAKMGTIRLQHVKRAMGDDAYLSGFSAPAPRAEDVLFLFSRSGETESLLGWTKEQKKFGGHVYSIVGRESSLSKESASFVIESTDSIFYERAAFASSVLPLHLVERLYYRGFKLPEYIIKWMQHSITE